MFQLRLFLVFILLNLICNSYQLSSSNRKLSQLLQNSDYDNRYVWFTRDTHNQDDNTNINTNNQRAILLKKISSKILQHYKLKKF